MSEGSVFKATSGVMTVLPALQVKTAPQGSRLYEIFLLLYIKRIKQLRFCDQGRGKGYQQKPKVEADHPY